MATLEVIFRTNANGTDARAEGLLAQPNITSVTHSALYVNTTTVPDKTIYKVVVVYTGPGSSNPYTGALILNQILTDDADVMYISDTGNSIP